MIFQNTIDYAKSNVLTTILLLTFMIVINVYMTAAITSDAPGFPILVGIFGGIIGVFIGVFLSPPRNAALQLGASVNNFLDLL